MRSYGAGCLEQTTAHSERASKRLRPRVGLTSLRWCLGSMLASLVTLPLTWASPSLARNELATAPAEAERRFESGLEWMKAGDYVVACPLIAESYRLDPLPGVLFTLAECEALWGKLASALEHYTSFIGSLTSMDAARRAVYEERLGIALVQSTSLGVTAPEVSIDVAPESPKDLKVRLNGRLVPATSYGVGQKVDPGEYLITAESGQQQVWLRRIKVTERSRARIEVRVTPRGSATPKAPRATQPGPNRSSVRREVAYISGGVGLLGLACGAVAGALALAQKSSVDQNCPDHVCNVEGRRALDTARTEAMVSNVGFAVGLLGVAAASVVWFAWPSAEQHQGQSPSAARRGAVRIGVAAAHLAVEGVF
jgi:hypothetical protein